jgi:hypothetical protein
MRTSDRITIRTDVPAAKPAAEPLWKFRAAQIVVVLVACLFADQMMTGGKIRSELAQDAGYVWRTVQGRIGR